MVAGDRSEDRSNDMRTQPAVMHCIQGMWNTLIQAASHVFKKLESDYETLLNILAGGDAPGAAHMARRTGAWMASDDVAGKLARLSNADDVAGNRALLFPIVCLALFTQTAYSPNEFSMLYNFRLWVFAFFSWVTMSDWSQRTAERNATLTLYWSSLFSMCMFSFQYRKTLASINEESGEATFRAEGIATQTGRRKHRLDKARVSRHMKDQIEDRTTHEAARPSHTRSRILHTPLSNVHVHPHCCFSRKFPIGKDRECTVSDPRMLWLNFWLFGSVLDFLLGVMEGEHLFGEGAISLLPNGCFQFLTAPSTSKCIKVSPLVICYCDERLAEADVRFPIPLRFVLLVRRWFMRVGKGKATSLIRRALLQTKRGGKGKATSLIRRADLRDVPSQTLTVLPLYPTLAREELKAPRVFNRKSVKPCIHYLKHIVLFRAQLLCGLKFRIST
jgi:hypothetical protein